MRQVKAKKIRKEIKKLFNASVKNIRDVTDKLTIGKRIGLAFSIVFKPKRKRGKNGKN